MKNSLILLFALSSMMSLAACRTVPGTSPETEYRVERVEFKYDPPTGLQDYLNTMSKDGWRLVQFVEHDTWYRVVMSRQSKKGEPVAKPSGLK